MRIGEEIILFCCDDEQHVAMLTRLCKEHFHIDKQLSVRIWDERK